MTSLVEQLRELYGDASKHSRYQSVPAFAAKELGYSEEIDHNWRGDSPRLAFLLACRAPAPSERWIDFGANTGYFVLSLAHAFPSTSFFAVEANENHARFIKRIASAFSISNIEVLARGIGIDQIQELPSADVMLHFNVLHHAGHDFDRERVRTPGEFPTYARDYLRRLHDRTEALFFQVGTNWGGNRAHPLAGDGDDAAKLAFVSQALLEADWRIDRAAYPERGAQRQISYKDISPKYADGRRHYLGLEHLEQFPGEFYRRPILYCTPTVAKIR